jgi:hypothetical protein
VGYALDSAPSCQLPWSRSLPIVVGHRKPFGTVEDQSVISKSFVL